MGFLDYKSLKNIMLTKELFMQNAGKINGTNFVKIVYDREKKMLCTLSTTQTTNSMQIISPRFSSQRQAQSRGVT